LDCAFSLTGKQDEPLLLLPSRGEGWDEGWFLPEVINLTPALSLKSRGSKLAITLGNGKK
jgi:hypothetical protein